MQGWDGSRIHPTFAEVPSDDFLFPLVMSRFGQPVATKTLADVKSASGRFEDGKFGLLAWIFFPIRQLPADVPEAYRSAPKPGTKCKEKYVRKMGPW